MILTDWIVWGALLVICLSSFSKASIVVIIEASIAYSLVNYLEAKPELWDVLGVDYMLIMAIKDLVFLSMFLMFIQRYALVKIAYSTNMLANFIIYLSYHYGSDAMYDFSYDFFYERMQLTVNALFIVGLIINDRNRILRRTFDAYNSVHSGTVFIISHSASFARRLLRVKKS